MSVGLGLGNLGFECGTTSGFATIYPSLIYCLAKETSQNLKSVHSNCLERSRTEFLLQVGPKFDTEVLAQWYRAELEKEEEKMRAYKVTRPKPRMLSRHTGKPRALDEVPAEPSAVRSGSPNKDTAPPAKRSRRKLMNNTNPDL